MSTLASFIKRHEGYRACKDCQELKAVEDFHKDYKPGRKRNRCKVCENARNKVNYYKNKDKIRKTQKKYEQKLARLSKDSKKYKARFMYKSAQHRAKVKGIPFSITAEDIVIPDLCPALKIPLKLDNETSSFDSPTLDRIIPEKGYTPENIMVLSLKANVMKSNATPKEIMKLAMFLARMGIEEAA